MANRRFTQFSYSAHAMPVHIDGNFAVGATGAVGTLKGPGITSVTRLAQGVYRVKLQDNYYKLYGFDWSFQAPVTGADVTDGSFVVGTPYQITLVGDTDWFAVGLPRGVTPAVGMSFVATAVGGAGTGTAKALGSSGIFAVELIGDSNLQLGPVGPGIQGGTIIVKCLDAAGAATDPANGSQFYFDIYISNSSVVVQGE